MFWSELISWVVLQIAGLRVYFWLWEHLCDQVKIFRCTAEILGVESKLLGAQLQILVAPTPKEYLLTLEKEQLRLRAAI